MIPSEETISPLQPILPAQSETKNLSPLIKLASSIFIGFGILICSFALINFFMKGNSTQPFEVISPLAQAAEQAIITILPNPAPQVGLQTIITNALTDTEGTYGIVVKNLKTHETYMLNEHRSFETASLYKLWVMAEVVDQVKTGKLPDDDTIQQPLTQMITISDNDAAVFLFSKVTLPTVTNFLQQQGFTQSFLGTDSTEPTSTAFDIATFFEKLYTGTLADSDETARMITLLKDQRLNNKLPKYLPAGTVLAHKTGELDQFSHDAGIVYTPSGDYVIVILSESADPQKANEQIATISKAVYAFETKSQQ